MLANSDGALYETRVYAEQLRLIQKEVDRISLTNLDLLNAENTAVEVKAEDILVPIGGGAYIKANIYNTKIFVPVGAGYIVEMDADEASRELKRRVEATKKAIETLSDEYKTSSKKLTDASKKLREIKQQQRIDKQVEDNISEDYI